MCNNDDEKYLVELYGADDDTLVDDFNLSEIWDVSDRCDEFEDLPAGDYYIQIYEDGEDELTDTSVVFTLDGEDDESFVIDTSGDIEKD